jgi:hypothetical protein
MPWTTHPADSTPPLRALRIDQGRSDAVVTFFEQLGSRARFKEIDGALCIRLTGATFGPDDPAPVREIIEARLTPDGVEMRRTHPGHSGDDHPSAISDVEIARQWRELPDGQRDASVLLTLIVNTVIDTQHDVLDEIRSRVDRLDEALLAPNPPLNEILPQIQQLGAHLGAVRDGILPLRPQVREVLELREPVERGLLSAAGARWLANIDKDLSEEVPSSLTVVEKRVATTMANLHGERSESTNRIVALLTVVTTAFFVPTLFTGLYGMNVPLPGQERHFAFWVVIALTGVLLLFAGVMITKMGLWGTFRRLMPTPKDLLKTLDLWPDRSKDEPKR